jgi:hypothetical protein
LGVAVIIALIAAGSADAATRYRITAVTASAQLTFAAGKANTDFVKGSVLMQLRGRRFVIVKLSPSGGRVVTNVRFGELEQVNLGSRADESQPYTENRCERRRRSSGKGGLVLRKTGPGRLQVRWAFPQAATSFCPGPRVAVPKALASRMVTTTSARVGAKILVFKLAGTAPLQPFTVSGFAGTGTYRWSATVKLARL